MSATKKRLLLSALAFTLSSLLTACDGNANTELSPNGLTANDSQTVRGLLLDVQPSSFFGLKSLVLVDDKGSQWEFEGRDVALPGFAASHLREHMLLGLQIVVTFEDDNGVLVITNIEDASAATPP